LPNDDKKDLSGHAARAAVLTTRPLATVSASRAGMTSVEILWRNDAFAALMATDEEGMRRELSHSLTEALGSNAADAAIRRKLTLSDAAGRIVSLRRAEGPEGEPIWIVEIDAAEDEELHLRAAALEGVADAGLFSMSRPLGGKAAATFESNVRLAELLGVQRKAASLDSLGEPPEPVPSLEAYLARLFPEDATAEGARIEKALATGAGYSAEIRAMGPDGPTPPLSVRCAAETVDNVGRFVCAVRPVVTHASSGEAIEADADAGAVLEAIVSFSNALASEKTDPRIAERVTTLSTLADRLHDLIDAPRYRDAPAAANAPKEPIERPLRVLGVDDVLLNRAVLSSHFEELDDEFTAARSGAEALQIMQKAKPFDLILMDVQMPGMNGFEALEAIRAIGIELGGPPPRIVAMTAFASTKDERGFRKAGFDGLLMKPIEMGPLRKQIARAAGREVNLHRRHHRATAG
jgi:CheY-like chemotaxis protein